jgi:hypothetical protein
VNALEFKLQSFLAATIKRAQQDGRLSLMENVMGGMATAKSPPIVDLEEMRVYSSIRDKIPGFDGNVFASKNAKQTCIVWRGASWTIELGERIPEDVMGQMLLLA